MSGSGSTQLPSAQPDPSRQQLRPLGHASDEPPNILIDFLNEHARSWGTAPARLSALETGVLWLLFALNVALGARLVSSPATVSGLVGTVVTLGGHPTLTVVLAGTCVGALLVAMPLTRGLTRSGGRPLVLIAFGGLCGVTALAGVIAVLAAVGLGVAIALSILFVVVDRL
jgi:hypothetical protein